MSGIISYTHFGGKSGLLGSPVAFSIGLTDNGNQAISNTNGVPFAGMKYNIGGGMHATNGVFTAPVAGIYHFDVSLYAYSGTTDYDFNLQRNSQGDVIARFFKTVPSGWIMKLTGQSYIRRGEQVNVTNNIGSTRNVYAGNYAHSSFSGALIGVGTYT